MAKIYGRPTVELSITFALTESEARALDGIVGYGPDEFLKTFKEGLGQHYIRDHEDGLRSLFESVRQQLPHVLHLADDAKKIFTGEKVAMIPVPKAK